MTSEQALQLLNTIPDPEVPAISIVELGVVREVNIAENIATITMTPTYSGCPALKVMEEQVKEKLKEAGIQKVEIKLLYKPAWTTDWLSESTKQKLKEYGIAPPPKLTFEHIIPLGNILADNITCPYCDSDQIKLTSRFGSTACKALYYCNNCHQPFEQFKCH